MRARRVLVSPSRSFSHRLVLNRWFRFDQAGIYVVELRLNGSITTDTGLPIDVGTAGTVAVEVRPRSEPALKEASERLARMIIETADVAQRMRAARALSSVEDPVAVPYVASVLGATDTLDGLLIPGLGRMGGSEAWATLARLQKSSNRDRAALASMVLQVYGTASRR